MIFVFFVVRRRHSAMHGVLIIDKPEGPTSHDVVAIARRALNTPRIGHTGTLDPMATGVLPLAIGRATRLVQFLTASDKTYEAVVRLGVVTDTYDRLGTIVQALDPDAPLPGPDVVAQALDAFRGPFLQAPPPFSAKKIAGVRSYERARRGDTSLPPAPVTVRVHALDLLAYDAPFLRLRLTCSAGFYVRSLAHDVGERLGTGGTLEALRRTASGPFSIDHALPLDALADAGRVAVALIPLERLLPDWPAAVLTERGSVKVGHGQDVGPEDLAGAYSAADGRVRLLSEAGDLVAVAEPGARPGFLHPSVVLK